MSKHNDQQYGTELGAAELAQVHGGLYIIERKPLPPPTAFKPDLKRAPSPYDGYFENERWRTGEQPPHLRPGSIVPA